jgi:GT2 family glycosyltransferase
MKELRHAIVVPAFNAERTVVETLESLQRNTALNRIDGVYLLDDASSDATATRARAVWTHTTPLNVWPNPQNMGERRTVNLAFEALSGVADWIFILHADDVVKENWLDLFLAETLTADSKVASICASYDTWYSASGRTEPGEESDRPVETIPGTTETAVNTIRRGCWWHISGCAIRVSAFSAIGAFRPDLPQLGDWEWLVRCLVAGYGLHYIPRAPMLYRQHEASVSSTSFREGRDVREKLDLLQHWRAGRLLSATEYAELRRDVRRQVLRRLIARIARRDSRGARVHAGLLMGLLRPSDVPAAAGPG